MSKSFDQQLRAAFDAGVKVYRKADRDFIEDEFERFRAKVADGPDDQPVPVPDDEPTSSTTYWHWD